MIQRNLGNSFLCPVRLEVNLVHNTLIIAEADDENRK